MAEIDLFTAFAKKIIEESDYTIDDEIYLVNQIMGLVGETNHNTAPRLVDYDSLKTLALLDQLTAVAEKNGTLSLRQMNTDMLGAQLMNFIVPRPSQVRKVFWEHYQQSPRQATDYFFDLSQRSNYIKTREISQNISYPVDTQYGTLQITINLSKPEKDPKAIAAALKNKNQQQSQYPVSQLAKENEGYWGQKERKATVMKTGHI